MGTYVDVHTGLTFYHFGDSNAPAGNGKGGQSFAKIVKECRETKKPFLDSYFPPDNSSLGKELIEGDLADYTIKWLRPNEISKLMFPTSTTAPIFHGKFDQFGVHQGTIGDCWFLAVLADAALKPDCINTMIPRDNLNVGFGPGVFHFRFWCRGKWVDVIIDDQLPCLFEKESGAFITTAFTKPTEEGGFWAPLAEKAYAKVNGNFSTLVSGYAHEAMADFTGGLVDQIVTKELSLAEFTEKLRGAIKTNGLVAIGTHKIMPVDLRRHDESNPGDESISKDGIVGGHAYSVLDIQDVHSKVDPNLTHTLVSCRNPWGNKEEWIGAFSDSDPNGNWETVDKDLRTGTKVDGQFWIPVEDLLKYSSTFYDCQWSGSYRGDKTTCADGKTYLVEHGRFIEENSGEYYGLNNSDYGGKEGFYAHLTPLDPNSGEVRDGLRYNCPIAITMLYKDYNQCGINEHIPMYGYVLLWAPGKHVPEKDSQFFNEINECVLNELTFTLQQREFTVNTRLPEGTVFIVPWLEEWDDKEPPYYLRIICEGEVKKQSAFQENKSEAELEQEVDEDSDK